MAQPPAISPVNAAQASRSRIAQRASRLAPVLAVALLAFILRVWGVSWSLPYVGHVDEPKIVDSAVRMIKTGDLNPHLFIWPSFYIYVQAALYKINLLWGVWRGYYVGPESLPDTNHVFALAPALYLWGRTLSAVVGAAAVATLFVLGRAMFNWRVGLAAALLLLVSPLHIEYSHYLVTDVAVGFLGLLVLVASWRLATRPSLRVALLCGLLVGLTAGTKYNGVYIALIPLTALLLAPLPAPASWQARLRRAVAWGAPLALLAAAAFLLSNPYIILDWTDWSRGFTFQIGAYLPAENLSQMASSVVEHVTLLWETDKFLLLPGAIGAALFLLDGIVGRREPGSKRRWLLILLLLPFPIIYTLLMSRFKLVYERNLIIALPILALMAGYLIDRVAVFLTNLFARRPSRFTFYVLRFTVVILALLVAAEPAREMINFDGYMAAPESRNVAATWLMDQLAQGKRAAVELHPLVFCAPAPHDCPAPDVLAPNNALTDRPPQWYADHGYDYVVLSGEDYLNVGDPGKDRQRDATLWAQYSSLPGPTDGPRIFAGDKQGGKGPTVTVLRVGQGIDALPVMFKPQARFGDIAMLWGYDLTPLPSTDQQFDPATDQPGAAFVRGQALGLNLYWRALRSGANVSGNWTVAVHLVAPDGSKVAQIDVPPISHGRQRPVQQWYNNEFVPGAYNLPLPATMVPGAYTVTITLYDAPSGPSLKATLPDGTQVDYLTLDPITVK